MGLDLNATDRLRMSESIERRTDALLVFGIFMGIEQYIILPAGSFKYKPFNQCYIPAEEILKRKNRD